MARSLSSPSKSLDYLDKCDLKPWGTGGGLSQVSWEGSRFLLCHGAVWRASCGVTGEVPPMEGRPLAGAVEGLLGDPAPSQHTHLEACACPKGAGYQGNGELDYELPACCAALCPMGLWHLGARRTEWSSVTGARRRVMLEQGCGCPGSLAHPGCHWSQGDLLPFCRQDVLSGFVPGVCSVLPFRGQDRQHRVVHHKLQS